MQESFTELWNNLLGRFSGSMSLRLILQPSVAAFFGIRSGLRDAKEGRTPFAWAIVTDQRNRVHLLRKGWGDVGKVFIFAMILDDVYQYIVFRRFYVTGAAIIALMLVCIAYVLIRALTNRIASLRSPRHRG